MLCPAEPDFAKVKSASVAIERSDGIIKLLPLRQASPEEGLGESADL